MVRRSVAHTAGPHAAGAMWHCPHCGARQAEAGRCWVCHRSSTCCGTCARFRSSLVGGVGYCALDRTRSPLRGDELRGCWEPPNDGLDTTPLAGLGLVAVAAIGESVGAATHAERPPRTWIPVEPLPSEDASAAEGPAGD